MDKLSDAQKQLQVQAYVGEYQALMTRNNWFMSLQFMPLVPLVGFFSFIVLAHTYLALNFILVAWAAAAVTQIAVLIYYFALHEVYNHALYLEKTLKPRVAVLLQLNTDSFWGWEGHLKQFGKAYDPRFSDRMPVVFSAIAFFVPIVIAITSMRASGWSYLGTVPTGILLYVAVVSSNRVVKVYRELEAAT